MEITITIKGLDQLTESLALIGSALAYQKSMAPTAKAAADLMNEVTSVPESEEKITEAPDKVPEEEPKNKVIAEGPPMPTIEQVRKVFVNKNNIKGNTPKLKAILNGFGVKKVTDLKEEDFPEVLKKLEEI
jgi:hypothetical protein